MSNYKKGKRIDKAEAAKKQEAAESVKEAETSVNSAQPAPTHEEYDPTGQTKAKFLFFIAAIIIIFVLKYFLG